MKNLKPSLIVGIGASAGGLKPIEEFFSHMPTDNGMAFVDLPNSLNWFNDSGQHNESLESERPVGEQLLGQFYRSITSLVRNQSSLNDAYRAMKVVLACNESAETGQRVEIQFDE